MPVGAAGKRTAYFVERAAKRERILARSAAQALELFEELHGKSDIPTSIRAAKRGEK